MKVSQLLFLFLVLSACGNSNKLNQTKDSVIYSKFSQELNGNLTITLLNDSDIRCSANIIQLSSSNYDIKDLQLTAVNGEVTLKLLDEKSYYFTPSCNNKKVELIVHPKNNGSKIIAVIPIYPKKK